MPDNRFKYVKAPGVLNVSRLRTDGFYPGDERLSQGPVAVFECMQEIACNPCEEACRKGHIRIGEEITRLPQTSEGCD